MNEFTSQFVFTGIIAGLVGAVAMIAVMSFITKAGWGHGNMLVALGSLLTRSRDNAITIGSIAHIVVGIGFGLLYTFLLYQAGLTTIGATLPAGIAIGAVHGLVVSLTLVWVVAEAHPLEEYSNAGFEVGLTHMAGHVAYGAAVGLTVALAL